MILLSELISKRVISMSNAKDEGTVIDVLFNQKLNSITYLKLFSDLDSEAEVRFLDFKKIKSIGADAVVINDSSAISFDWNTTLNTSIKSPMNQECFNQDGQLLGYVKDIELENAKIINIIIADKKIPPLKVLSSSQNLLIINDSNKPIKLTKPTSNQSKLEKLKNNATGNVTLHSNVTPVQSNSSLQSIDPLQFNETIVYAPKGKENPQSTSTLAQTQNADLSLDIKPVARPPRVPPLGSVNPKGNDASNSPYKFLLGKTLMRDIKLDSGELLFLAKTIITEKIITTARDKGKLVQLALHAE